VKDAVEVKERWKQMTLPIMELGAYGEARLGKNPSSGSIEL